jgi:hypothetical protein
MTGKKKLAEYYNKLSIGIIPVTDILNNKTLNSNY